MTDGHPVHATTSPAAQPGDAAREPSVSPDAFKVQGLGAVLRDLRLRLLARPAIARAVRERSRHVSAIDLYLTLGCLLSGIAGHAVAFATGQWLLVPLCVVLQLVGYAGVSSLAHEAWHGRSHPSRAVDRLLSRWLFSALLLVDNEVQGRDHQWHHRLPGEPEDPNNVTWTIPWPQFRRNLIGIALVIPGAIMKLKFLLTGKRADQNYDDGRNRASARVWATIVVVHGCWALGLLWISWWALLAGYLVPVSLAGVMARLREYREHARLADGSTAVFDLLCPRWQRLLIPGGYFNYHALHHLFPEVPQRQLPRLYAEIARVIDMSRDYYGQTPMVSLKSSYLQ